MKYNLQTVKVISIEDLRAAIESLGSKRKYIPLDLADIVYLTQVSYQDLVTTEEKKRVVAAAIEQEPRMISEVIERISDQPYLLRKYIEVASLYVDQNIYCDYWGKIRNCLYRTLVEVYGHDLYTIEKVSLYALRCEIEKMKKLSRKQVREWAAANFPKQRHQIVEYYFLDKLDLWYMINHHPQKKEIPAEDYRLVAEYVEENYYDLFKSMVGRGCDYENEYEIRKRYFFTLSMEDWKTARVYRCILNEDYATEIPDDDCLENYLARL